MGTRTVTKDDIKKLVAFARENQVKPINGCYYRLVTKDEAKLIAAQLSHLREP